MILHLSQFRPIYMTGNTKIDQAYRRTREQDRKSSISSTSPTGGTRSRPTFREKCGHEHARALVGFRSDAPDDPRIGLGRASPASSDTLDGSLARASIWLDGALITGRDGRAVTAAEFSRESACFDRNPMRPCEILIRECRPDRAPGGGMASKRSSGAGSIPLLSILSGCRIFASLGVPARIGGVRI